MLYCIVRVCVCVVFLRSCLPPIKGLYPKKSWSELSRVTGLRVRMGSGILHTPDCVQSNVL